MKHLKKLLKNNLQILGGIITFGMFFTYGIANNLSFSYMGNSSETARKFIMDNFLGAIILFILKLFFLYLIIGIVFGVISSFVINFYQKDIRKKYFSMKFQIALNTLLSFIIYLPFFFENLILYPQVYINGFYAKSGFNKSLVDFLADNFSPSLFAIIQIIFISMIILLIILKSKTQTINFIQRYKKPIIKLFVPAAVISIGIMGFTSFHKSVELNRDDSKPNVIILASDALRPDHISAYGYSRKTTPNIDTLVKGGVNFMNTHIEVPRTFPSWVSTLTGRFASSHGIRHMFPTSRNLNQKFRALPELLNKNGYDTSAIADYAGDIFSRVRLGFKNIDTPYFNADHILYQAILDAHVFLMPFLTNQTGLDHFPFLKDSAYFCPPELVTKRIEKRIEQSKGKPFFITTFFSSTHFPYAPPAPYYKKYAEKNYSGPYKYLKQQIIALDNQKVSKKLTEADKRQVNALYDGGLNAFDHEIGKIIKFLKDNKIRKNTIIIVMSDHGENLYEGDLGMGHGEHFRGLYATKIPLIFNYQKLSNKEERINKVSRGVDIAPTIIDLLNIKTKHKMEGKSLLPIIEGKEKGNRFAFGETGIWFDNSTRTGLFFQKQRIMYPDITGLSIVDFNFDNQVVLNDNYSDVINMAKHRYIYDGRYRLIYIPLKTKIIYELYDTVMDPFAKKNIVKSKPAIAARLKKELFKWITRNGDVMIKKEFIYPLTRY